MAAEYANLFSGPIARKFLEQVAEECGITRAPDTILDLQGRTDPNELLVQHSKRELAHRIFELAGARLEVVVNPAPDAPRQTTAES
jgi:hypothetical protein